MAVLIQRQRRATYGGRCAFSENMRQAFLRFVTQKIAVNAAAKDDETGACDENQKNTDR